MIILEQKNFASDGISIMPLFFQSVLDISLAQLFCLSPAQQPYLLELWSKDDGRSQLQCILWIDDREIIESIVLLQNQEHLSLHLKSKYLVCAVKHEQSQFFDIDHLTIEHRDHLVQYQSLEAYLK